MRIGIDIMGGDYAPGATLKGACDAIRESKGDMQVVMIGDEAIIRELLSKEEPIDEGRYEIVHTSQVIGMAEHPTKSIARKRDSSIMKGFDLLKSGSIDSFCGNGNTGAMLVGAMYSVRVIPGVIRPAITSFLPKPDGKVGVILDVGANADCRPDVLYQFAILGSACAEKIYRIENPKVGLMNIGEEEGKGNLLTQAAYEMMKDSDDFNFIGNIEGRNLFDDNVDVIVCDGFTGNVLLKCIEGFYKLITCRGRSDDYFDRFNFELYGGTPILGINSDVIIGHGISEAFAVKNMILLARDVVNVGLSTHLKRIFK